jgi:hypothetical protein
MNEKQNESYYSGKMNKTLSMDAHIYKSCDFYSIIVTICLYHRVTLLLHGLYLYQNNKNINSNCC